MPVEALTVADLGPLGERLGAGAQAVIHDAPALRLPDAADRLVYKQYRPGKAARRQDMEGLIELRATLGDADRAHLDTITTWPVRVVVDGVGDPLGVVLPRIHDTFFQPVIRPMSGEPDVWVREVQHLFVDPQRCGRVGMPSPTQEQRLLICRDFAAALDFLHSPPISATFGDINAKNELFRLDAEPTVMFVDCDAVRVRGSVTGQPMLNAPDWEPPIRTPLNQDTDRYKLGLFVLRCLTPPGHQASTRRRAADAAGVLDADGYALLEAALDDAPGGRPTAYDWVRHLSALLGQPVEPPTLDGVRLDRTLVAAGEPVTVHWAATGATSVEVSAVGVDTVVDDGRAGSGAVRIHPVRTGRLTVTARNASGVDARRTGPVAVFDVPDFARMPVPVPELRLGGLPADLPDVRPVLALRPPEPNPPVFTGDPARYRSLPRPPATLPGIDLDERCPVDPVALMLATPDVTPPSKRPRWSGLQGTFRWKLRWKKVVR